MSSIQLQRILDYAFSTREDENTESVTEEEIESLSDSEREELVQMLKKSRNDAARPRIKEVLELMGEMNPSQSSAPVVDSESSSLHDSDERDVTPVRSELPETNVPEVEEEFARTLYQRHISKLLAGFRLAAALFSVVFFIFLLIISFLFGDPDLFGNLVQSIVSAGLVLGALLFWVHSTKYRAEKLIDGGELVEVISYDSPVPVSDYGEILPGILRRASWIVYGVFFAFNRLEESIIPISIVRYSVEDLEDRKLWSSPDFYLEGEAVVKDRNGTAYALVDPETRKGNGFSWMLKERNPDAKSDL